MRNIFFAISLGLFVLGCNTAPQEVENEDSVSVVSSETIITAAKANILMDEMRDIALEAVKEYRNSAKKNLQDKAVEKLINDSSDKNQKWYIQEEIKIEEKVIELLIKLAETETKWRKEIDKSWPGK